MIHQPTNIWGEGYVPQSSTVGAFCDIAVPLGAECKVQSHVSISPGWRIGNRVFIGPGARFANDRHPAIGTTFTPEGGSVGDCAVIGMGALLLPGVKIGSHAVIGAGAVVTKDVPAGETWVGNPAKKLPNSPVTPPSHESHT